MPEGILEEIAEIVRKREEIEAKDLANELGIGLDRLVEIWKSEGMLMPDIKMFRSIDNKLLFCTEERWRKRIEILLSKKETEGEPKTKKYKEYREKYQDSLESFLG